MKNTFLTSEADDRCEIKTRVNGTRSIVFCWIVLSSAIISPSVTVANSRCESTFNW